MYGLQQDGVVVARVMLGCWHYVLVTGADGENVYLFDPY
ncbi:MAG TPA: peptidase C39, partial [Lachnoclostridium sp.]|nr:peptidase C39 [Lachnoclostridium sp.]